jgi:UDP-glucuronate 4-epimerase
MSLFKFTKNILNSKKIDLFNKGNHERDFTHVDDVVSNIINLVNRPSLKSVPYEVYNIASGKPKKLMYFLKIIENNLKKNASLNMKELQKGDVIKTHASINKIVSKTGIKKRKSFEKGIKSFVNWYKKYYS